MKRERERDFITFTLVLYAAAGELKTKPTQHSVRDLMQIGIAPDILLCRSDRQLSRDLRSKIALSATSKSPPYYGAGCARSRSAARFHEQELDDLLYVAQPAERAHAQTLPNGVSWSIRSKNL